jgi:predicted ATPase with chaperone activity
MAFGSRDGESRARRPSQGERTFDLPIAIGVLAATGQVPMRALPGLEFAGELALSGELRAIRGALAMTSARNATAGRSCCRNRSRARRRSRARPRYFPRARCSRCART